MILEYGWCCMRSSRKIYEICQLKNLRIGRNAILDVYADVRSRTALMELHRFENMEKMSGVIEVDESMVGHCSRNDYNRIFGLTEDEDRNSRHNSQVWLFGMTERRK